MDGSIEWAVVQVSAILSAGFYCVVFHAFRCADPDNRSARERWVGLGLILATCAIGLAATRAARAAEFEAAGLVGLASVGAAFVVALLQGTAIRAAGSIALQKELAAALIEVKRWTAAVGALAGMPVVLLITGSHPVRDRVLIYFIAAEAIALLILFLVRTLRLFVRQKVSVLVWFLYLCSVEVVPICAIAALVVRFV